MSQFTVPMDGAASPVPGNGEPSSRLTRSSSVLAIVPHYQCEAWLGDCLDSLVRQTRPPDGIVVIDDGSGSPPTDIVRHFPTVTLLASADNVGPYRLTQAVIDQTGYDAYLMQDADDWSAPLRLELLLAAAERARAELVGCQAYRVIYPQAELETQTYPLDVNAGLMQWPTWYALLHPTSLVSRDLVVRIGGYATGLKFNGDLEFLHRAARIARVVNIPQFVYYKRIQSRGLTSRPDTGLQSPARQALLRILDDRALALASLGTNVQLDDLKPLTVAGPISLTHLAGPRLRLAPHVSMPA